jgi:hypothetical protein
MANFANLTKIFAGFKPEVEVSGQTVLLVRQAEG